jgi:hypothetical protein
MPLGPKRAPGRYEVPVSNGAPVDVLDPTSTSTASKSLTAIPMNAMSYFTSLERQGWYFRRPKVEMPEKIESACTKVN